MLYLVQQVQGRHPYCCRFVDRIVFLVLTASVLSGIAAGPILAGDEKPPQRSEQAPRSGGTSTNKQMPLDIDLCEGSQPPDCANGCKPHPTKSDKCILKGSDQKE